MSQVFTCQCGRKTTQPFLIKDTRYCVFCAEEIAPDIVDKREERDLRRVHFNKNREWPDQGKFR
jgi:hypothetical protein